MSEPVSYLDLISKVRRYWWQGKYWYRVSDICALFGITDHRKAVIPIPDKYRRKLDLSDPRGVVQETWTVDLTGLFMLIITSRKPKARPYQEWLAVVVAQSPTVQSQTEGEVSE